MSGADGPPRRGAPRLIGRSATAVAITENETPMPSARSRLTAAIRAMPNSFAVRYWLRGWPRVGGCPAAARLPTPAPPAPPSPHPMRLSALCSAAVHPGQAHQLLHRPFGIGHPHL